ncbi:arylsulfatase A-like enzyme [Dyadobacter jejuensis]|uniref:Arylsulfatase A-like enzyme n=1 Tax=Dyadobacter jejuensis TaxID=1082580 RepID=A0A316AKR4_9BACT|nr:sulfatase [Dyadobacter jejuensis]PWJ57614.1 arylsulfatase A-like enzyme [Dyadobacter jejuensis]
MLKKIQFPILALALCVLCAFKAPEKPKKPNILFIMADDHTAQSWGIYGGFLKDYVKVDNITRLANEGCVLENCLVSNSICVPSRASIVTGQYSHVNGVKTLGGALSPEVDNIQKQLQKGGYQTSLIGKWHLKKEPSGFDYYSVFPGQGVYFDPLMISKGDWLPNEGGGKVHKGFSTDIVTDMTIDWIENRDQSKPFMMMCHFKATHEPFDYPERFKDLYKDIDIPVPPTFWDSSAATTNRPFTGQSIDELQRRMLYASEDPSHWVHHMMYPELPFTVAGLTREAARMKTYQKFIKDYMRCAAAIDDNIGRLLDYLDKNGLAENTIVIYTSDQGYFLGEHGWFDKRLIYEESVHMPFVIRYPKEIPANTRNSDLIENVDFSALFADYAGIKYPSSMQGVSFRENLKGKTPKNWRKYGYYRYWESSKDRPGHFGIRGSRYKLAFYYGNGLKENNYKPGEEPTLYWDFHDLQEDPLEVRNGYKEPKYQDIIANMKKEIISQRQLLGDTDQGNEEILAIIAKHWND